jgi:hypothetical protein
VPAYSSWSFPIFDFNRSHITPLTWLFWEAVILQFVTSNPFDPTTDRVLFLLECRKAETAQNEAMQGLPHRVFQLSPTGPTTNSTTTLFLMEAQD